MNKQKNSTLRENKERPRSGMTLHLILWATIIAGIIEVVTHLLVWLWIFFLLVLIFWLTFIILKITGE